MHSQPSGFPQICPDPGSQPCGSASQRIPALSGQPFQGSHCVLPPRVFSEPRQTKAGESRRAELRQSLDVGGSFLLPSLDAGGSFLLPLSSSTAPFSCCHCHHGPCQPPAVPGCEEMPGTACGLSSPHSLLFAPHIANPSREMPEGRDFPLESRSVTVCIPSAHRMRVVSPW